MGVGIVHHCDGEKKEDGEGGMERNFISDISARSLRVRHDKALGFLVASFIIFDDEMRKERKKGKTGEISRKTNQMTQTMSRWQLHRRRSLATAKFPFESDCYSLVLDHGWDYWGQ